MTTYNKSAIFTEAWEMFKRESKRRTKVKYSFAYYLKLTWGYEKYRVNKIKREIESAAIQAARAAEKANAVVTPKT